MCISIESLFKQHMLNRTTSRDRVDVRGIVTAQLSRFA